VGSYKRVLSVNVGKTRSVPFAGQTVTTGIFKVPVEHPVVIGPLGLHGDVQADLSVHGGAEKAVYLYAHEHYERWQALLKADLQPGNFGENITAQGFVEENVYIGDILRTGTALLQVVQPRSPCYKLQVRFARPDMVALFVRQGHPGWYASVLEEGTVQAYDGIQLEERTQDKISIADVWRYSLSERADPDTYHQILSLPLLPAFWKDRVTRG
jgi:MOSC domain-containing protein YiiM